ncbi:MAG TPA: enolase C-terminal domain-like protein [Pirellulales bacterium]|jgi:L-alanine-DL-glutamate epimerase-like enolase superfamily enzyme|nr:enolase C-terminal domain-like protein [Pirellulales bacterium]
MASTISHIETFAADYPVAGHFKFFDSGRGPTAVRPTIVVKIVADDGTTGWGQAVPSQRWSYETPETVRSTIDRYLAPELIGRDSSDLAGAHAAMNRAIAPSFSTGQPLAKAGIDLALHDLAGKATGRTVAELWGRPPGGTVELSWTLNPQTLDEVAGQIEIACQQGYRSFNVKVGNTVEADLALCREVRRAAPQAFVWVDANGGYDEASALTIAPRLADLGIAAFEQPLPANRLRGLRTLKRQGALPIVLDEPIVSRVDLEEFLGLGLLDGVTMKVSRCGGLFESLATMKLIEDSGLFWLGSGLTDPDISLAASLVLFAAFGLERPAALNAPQFLTTSILKSPLAVTDARCAVPTDPGLGVIVDESSLRDE